MKTLIRTIAALTVAMTVSYGTWAQDETEDTEETTRHFETKRHNIFSRKDFGLYLGLNNFDTKSTMPELDNLKSRYIGLNWRKNHRLITGKNVDVAFGTGFEVAWNNYMVKDNIILSRQPNGSDFVEVKEYLDKSKLVVTNFNIPLMLQFGFKESNWILGLGAYGGARIDSYMKTKGEKGTDRDHGAYNLNKFHYGLAAEIGRKSFAFFVRYQMTPLFKDNNPINGNSIMFGVRL